jgi:3-dehydroquinate synthase
MTQQISDKENLLGSESPPSALPTINEQLRVEISVNFIFDLHFTHKVFDTANLTLANIVGQVLEEKNTKMMFIIDQGVWDNQPNLQEHIFRYCELHLLSSPIKLISLPGGEEAKTQQQVNILHHEMLNLNLDRQSLIVAIGGGAVLDAVGFAATTFHRGIRLIRIPTTVLAQNDAGIGVKNGINAYNLKNLIGCFSPPYAVINDSAWLSSLSDRVYRSGFSEAVKVALIRDGDFYQWLCSNSDKLVSRNNEACQYLVQRCAELHLHQISCGGDPFEKGSSRPLDYGHWCAHKLEPLSNYDISHGEAVAIGIVLDALYAHAIGILSLSDKDNLISLIKSLGFSLWHPALSAESPQGKNLLLEGLEEFRQHLGGKLCITLLTGLGTAVEVDEIKNDIMLQCAEKLQKIANSIT